MTDRSSAGSCSSGEAACAETVGDRVNPAGAQLVGDGQTLGSLLVAEARRDELALRDRGAQGDEGCCAGHVAAGAGKLARSVILFTVQYSSQRPPHLII